MGRFDILPGETVERRRLNLRTCIVDQNIQATGSRNLCHHLRDVLFVGDIGMHQIAGPAALTNLLGKLDSSAATVVVVDPDMSAHTGKQARGRPANAVPCSGDDCHVGGDYTLPAPDQDSANENLLEGYDEYWQFASVSGNFEAENDCYPVF